MEKARTSLAAVSRSISDEQLGGGLAVRPGQSADLFDQVEELLPLLADQCLAEQVAESADIGTQGGIVGGRIGTRAVGRRGDLSGHGWTPWGGGVRQRRTALSDRTNIGRTVVWTEAVAGWRTEVALPRLCGEVITR